ncbi:hypothetical protein BTVI_118151 [Pitangus sulphuratus]|nr:hypothetical protein BTVI_118151 [Pitangus sulphuratus]
MPHALESWAHSMLTMTNCCAALTVLGPHFKKDFEVLKHTQKRAMELLKGPDRNSYEEQLRDLGLFSPEKKRLREDLITLYNYLERGWSEGAAGKTLTLLARGPVSEFKHMNCLN